MKKNMVPLLTVAFLVAVASTVIFYGLFVGKLGSSSTGPDQKPVVIAAKALTQGAVISKDDLGLLPWGSPQRPKSAFSNPDELIGKTVLTAVGEGEPLLGSHVVSKDGDGVGVPSGMRAVSIHVSDSTGVVALLRPGYKTDVQVFNPHGDAKGLRTILENISVLGVIPHPEQTSQGFLAPVVTLLVNARQADLLGAADAYARIRLSLRNPLDSAVLSTNPTPTTKPNLPTTNTRAATVRTTSSAVNVRVQLFSAKQPAFKEITDSFAVGEEPELFQATNAKPGADPKALMTKLQDENSVEVLSNSRVLASVTRAASIEVGPDERTQPVSLRIRFEPFYVNNQLKMRIVPEVTTATESGDKVRKVDTQVDLSRGGPVLLSGLATQGDRQVLALITPQVVDSAKP